MSDGSDKKWIAEQVELVRNHRRAQGHDLSALEQGIIEAAAGAHPAYDPIAAQELELIRAELERNSIWREQEEWRISTWFDLTIIYSGEKQPPYRLTVECDGQILSCATSALEAAYTYLNLYKNIIVNQFYTIGPPWAKSGIWQSKVT